ncbi:MAG: hypothetical protein NC121_05900 [Blautia sp.]|nr:hypothetical protein [Blautia sp.]
MTTAEKVFMIILLLNTIISIAYFIWGCMVQAVRPGKHAARGKGKPEAGRTKAGEPKVENAKEGEAGKGKTNEDSDPEQEEEENEWPEWRMLSRTGFFFKALVMLLCPVVGVLFFTTVQLMYVLFFRTKVDLTDVIFGKEKVVANRRADEESEKNRVPIEEALAVADKESLRSLVMDVVKGDVKKSLATISLALNSEDTETSHYAASVLRDALNDFRQEAQEIYNALHRGDDRAADYACMLIEYMNQVLSQDVFPEIEQRSYVDMMEEACTWLYRSEEHRYRLQCEYIEWIADLLLRLKEYERMGTWCSRCMEIYPEELTSYTIQLKLYFSIQDREKFFDTMDRLKKSDVVIDKDTLDLIRVFG